jgi:hypothetical protein
LAELVRWQIDTLTLGVPGVAVIVVTVALGVPAVAVLVAVGGVPG